MPSHHDYGIDCEHFCGGTPDDDLPCSSCGSVRCVNFACEDEGDLRFEIPPREQGPFLCTICHQNAVDALNGFDTCDECKRNA